MPVTVPPEIRALLEARHDDALAMSANHQLAAEVRHGWLCRAFEVTAILTDLYELEFGQTPAAP